MRLLLVSVLPALACGLACVSINGKAYPLGTRFASELACQPQQSSESFRVTVNDWMGNPLPGSRVQVSSGPGAVDEKSTGRDGAVVFPVAADRWLVSVRLPGFSSATRSVELEAGQACVVTFYLRLSDRRDPEIVSQLDEPPNPRLQRTPLRAPLSREPLGDKRLWE